MRAVQFALLPFAQPAARVEPGPAVQGLAPVHFPRAPRIDPMT